MSSSPTSCSIHGFPAATWTHILEGSKVAFMPSLDVTRALSLGISRSHHCSLLPRLPRVQPFGPSPGEPDGSGCCPVACPPQLSHLPKDMTKVATALILHPRRCLHPSFHMGKNPREPRRAPPAAESSMTQWLKAWDLGKLLQSCRASISSSVTWS